MQPALKIPFERHRYGLDLSIDARFADPGTRRWYRQPHEFDFYEILLVTAGRGRVRRDHLDSSVGPGTAVLTPPGSIRTLDLEPDSSRFIVCFQPEFLDRLPVGVWPWQRWPSCQPTRASVTLDLEPREHHSLLQILTSMQREITNFEEESRDLLWVRLQEVLLELRRARRKRLATGCEASAWARRFLALVERRFRQSHRVADYADWMAVTAGHLRRLTREHLGVSPKAVVRERLLHEARRLLLDSEQTVSQIAHGLGFEDPSYFSRFFRSWQGVSPQELRRQSAARDDVR